MATKVNLAQYRGLVGWAPSTTYGMPIITPVDYTVAGAGNLALEMGCKLLRLTLPADTNILYVKTGLAAAPALTVGTGHMILPGMDTPLVVGFEDGVQHTHLYWINAA